MDSNSIPPVNARLCRGGVFLASVTVLLLIVGNAVEWLVPQLTESAVREATALKTEQVFITPVVQWVGFVVTMLHVGVLAWGIVSMRMLFKQIAAGQAFVLDTALLLRRFGIALLVYAGLAPLVRSALAALASFDPVRHQLSLGVGVNSDELLVATIGALILVFSSVMADATRIAAENREII